MTLAPGVSDQQSVALSLGLGTCALWVWYFALSDFVSTVDMKKGGTIQAWSAISLNFFEIMAEKIEISQMTT